MNSQKHLIANNNEENIGSLSTNNHGIERTFIMIKPDGVQRGLIGSIISRFERKGLKLTAMKFIWASEELIRQMYADEASESYFPLLVQIMTSGPSVPMVWEGINAINIGRTLISEAITSEAAPGTIRGDLCLHVGRNVCHGADTKDEADMDIKIWFP